MIRFILKTKDGEVINKVYANSLVEASEVFAKVKRLPISDLLSLFIVGVEV